jgi:hypothetical protein
MLSRYSNYLNTVESNPKLLSDLAITHGIDLQRGTIVENPSPLPRVTAPVQINFVANQTAAQALNNDALKNLDPSQSALVEAPARPLAPQGADLRITNYDGDSYIVQSDAPAEFLLKLAVPYYPGWQASVDAARLSVFPVNEALQGVFVPAGKHQMKFWFEPEGFRRAVVLSLTGLFICAMLFVFPSVFSRPFR